MSNPELAAALAAVDANADAEWKECAAEAIRLVAHRQQFFITDDVRDFLAKHAPEAQTHNERALGPLMRKAMREGTCEPVICDACGSKVVVESQRHDPGRWDRTKYRSLIFGNELS